MNGGFSNRSDTLVICASGGLFQQDVSTVSTKLVYSYLLSATHVTPHCVAKFFPQFGPSSWSCTWRQLFFFDLDRQVIDLTWKVAHGVFFTARRLVSFGYSVPWVFFFVALLVKLWLRSNSLRSNERKSFSSYRFIKQTGPQVWDDHRRTQAQLLMDI